MTGPNLGPSRALLERLGRAEHSPLFMGMPFERRKALEARVIRCREFDQLAPDDQELIEAGEREVSAGLSPTLQDPADWGGDWAAEDEQVGVRRGAHEAKALELELEGKRFNPDQPRYPEGHPRAGQWMEVGDVALWLAGRPLMDGASSSGVQPSAELAGSTAAPAGNDRFTQHDDLTVRVAASLLTPPADYAHPRVLNAPVAKDLAKPKQTRAVSFRPGDVVEVDGQQLAVVTNQAKDGRQQLMLVGHDGQVVDVDVPPAQTLTSIARSPHPTVVADARRVIAAAAEGREIPAAPSLRGDVGRRQVQEDAEFAQLLAAVAADFEQPDREVTPADLEQWRGEWETEFDPQAEADALAYAAEDDAFLAGWATEWYSRPWALTEPEEVAAAMPPAPKKPRRASVADEQVREDYELYVESSYLNARAAVKDAIFSKAGLEQLARQNRAGYSGPILDDYALFRGKLPRKYASEELLDWFDQNGRLTFVQFKAQALGRDSDQRTARAGGAFASYKAEQLPGDDDGWAGI